MNSHPTITGRNRTIFAFLMLTLCRSVLWAQEDALPDMIPPKVSPMTAEDLKRMDERHEAIKERLAKSPSIFTPEEQAISHARMLYDTKQEREKSFEILKDVLRPDKGLSIKYAIAAAISVDDRTAPLLVDLFLHDPDPKVRRASMSRMRKHVDDQPLISRSLVDVMNNEKEDPELREMAAEVVARSNKPEVMQAIENYMFARDPVSSEVKVMRPKLVWDLREYLPARYEMLKAKLKSTDLVAYQKLLEAEAKLVEKDKGNQRILEKERSSAK